ncbi:MAG: hypothetical protein A2219_07770 [Elusimicrobia bacterium RIFOXYA2_FULL_50_26]|nr:MAG: hypothetical protein A2219_07770 [Elusimicrobia bacterium RIFOXYA2_FULL_50_26]OGS23543.1 MAG: hypothetical protein A2314_03295 [Elusimicrobia bacterium RIFOXYB2_FULL_50_12]
MKKIIVRYVITPLLLGIFIFVYRLLPDDLYRMALIPVLLPFGLYIGYTFPPAVALFNATGLALLLFTISHQWTGAVVGSGFMFMAAAIIPFYFQRQRVFEKEEFMRHYEPLSRELAVLQEQVDTIKIELQSFEQEIERISNLYVLGRELVEHVDSEEVLEKLQRILLRRPGVESVAIFSWEKGNWKSLQLSRPDEKDRWMEFVRNHKYLSTEKEPLLMPPPEWLDKNAMVFWPVRIDKALLASIFLVTEPVAALRQIEEGSIFLPQIALGLIRTKLFTEVKERSRNDSLTGLYRRGYFIERFETEIKRAERYKSSFSLFMMDIDHFKRVNDTYGHLAGDEVLRALAKLFARYTRPGDLLGRYGGEEFIVLLHMVTPYEAREIASDIKRAVSRHEFSAQETAFKVTISIGISHYPADGKSCDELLSAADHALYRVKASGRNGILEFNSLPGAGAAP